MGTTVECRQQSSFCSRTSPYIVNTSRTATVTARACVSTSQFAGSRTRGWAKLRRRRPRLRRRQHAAVPASRRVPSNYDNVALFLGARFLPEKAVGKEIFPTQTLGVGNVSSFSAFFVVFVFSSYFTRAREMSHYGIVPIFLEWLGDVLKRISEA